MASGKLNVAVLFGGRSTEHEISVITGLEVVSSFDSTRYDVTPVYIDQRGRWFAGDKLRDKSIYKNFSSYPPEVLAELKEVALLPVPGIGGLSVISKKGFSLFGNKNEVLPIDVFVPAFHGRFGEDGCIQGLFELADVPFTGCGLLASAVAMNKYICKCVLKAHGIPVLPGIVVHKSHAQLSLAKVRDQILATPGLNTFPLFVKPLNLGSSIGVSAAHDIAELEAGLAKAFQHDSEALVEPCISNKMEVNVSVRNTPTAEASVTEIPVASGEVLSYEDKYLRGGGKKGKASSIQAQGMASLTRVINPVDLPNETKSAVISHAIKSYELLGCAGIVRFDFMIDNNNGALYFNELNTLPGSLAHYLWDHCNPPVLYPQLLHDMIRMALESREQKSSLQHDVGFRALK